jgi:predicted mannosyl-3-phosphoglycerate phosphatase (HAD superfamily)
MTATTICRPPVDTLVVLVFASLDDRGREPGCESPVPRAAVDLLAHLGVRLILVSASAAASVRCVQRQLQIAEPFVCDGGAAVHVPGTEFGSPGPDESTREIFRFDPPDRASAVHLIRDLFLARGHDVITIGIGSDLDDYGVLSAVDVPVVIRDPLKDQQQLLRHVPGAYLTNATGRDGWSEALIGP